jgi:hypothetical protein
MLIVMTRLVQLRNRAGERRVAIVDDEKLRLLRTFTSTYDLALAVIERGVALDDVAEADAGDDTLAYEEIHALRAEWSFLPPIDHPLEPSRCLVSGTGLTHLASAQNRQAMHAATGAEVTDSMRMYLLGVEGGRPAPGSIGVAPEWFYKGCGTTVRGHGEALVTPAYAGDGGEEPEIVGAYVIGLDGQPYRAGLMIGNEFSDHRTEKKNYLYLAPSKLRNCAVGPELVVGAPFQRVPGRVSIVRGGETVWSKEIVSGEENMSHSLDNLEHHHFKFSQHRRPGDVHIHFFGADAFSFGAGVDLQDEDVMEVAFEGMGKPLRNSLQIERSAPQLIRVAAL